MYRADGIAWNPYNAPPQSLGDASASDAIGQFGTNAASYIMSEVKKFPATKRTEGLKIILNEIDPKLWAAVDAKVQKLVKQGITPGVAVESAIRAALANGLLDQYIKLGNGGPQALGGWLKSVANVGKKIGSAIATGAKAVAKGVGALACVATDVVGGAAVSAANVAGGPIAGSAAGAGVNVAKGLCGGGGGGGGVVSGGVVGGVQTNELFLFDDTVAVKQSAKPLVHAGDYAAEEAARAAAAAGGGVSPILLIGGAGLLAFLLMRRK